ncbi:MAG: GntR family transcriptional regulator [Ignavibacteriaceae bacterium]
MKSKSTEKNNKSNKEKIYLQLKLDIISHRLRAGQSITEEDIVKKYSISRTPVREIFRKLENDGLVRNIPYKGTYVSDLTREDIEEILDIRYALESFAARCTAEKLDKEGLKKFIELEDQFKLANGSQNSVLSFETDTKLHELILDIAGNKRIRSIITNLLGQIHRIRFISGHFEGRIETTVKEHLEIINAIKKKDPELAEKKMQVHIGNTKKLLLKSSQMEEQFSSIISLSN